MLILHCNWNNYKVCVDKNFSTYIPIKIITVALWNVGMYPSCFTVTCKYVTYVINRYARLIMKSFKKNKPLNNQIEKKDNNTNLLFMWMAHFVKLLFLLPFKSFLMEEWLFLAVCIFKII